MNICEPASRREEGLQWCSMVAMDFGLLTLCAVVDVI
jgi:hypothetical protein